MEEDEERTIALLTTHNEIVLPLVETAGGEVIDAANHGYVVQTVYDNGSIAYEFPGFLHEPSESK